MTKPIFITLHVEASNLFEIENPTQEQIDKHCSFSDNNNGKSPNGTLEDFTTEVYIDNNVKWLGQTSDRGFTIDIDSISFKPKGSEANFFNSDVLKGSGGIVHADVLNDDRLKGKMYDYLISFSVTDSQNSSKSYGIDPKLQVNP